MGELKHGSFPLYQANIQRGVRRLAWIRPLSFRKWPALRVYRVRVRPSELVSRKAIIVALFEFFATTNSAWEVINVRHAKRREWLVSISHRH